MKKKWLYPLLLLTFSAVLLTGCGNSNTDSKEEGKNQTEQQPEAPADDREPDKEGSKAPDTSETEDFENMTELDVTELAPMEKALDSLMVTSAAYELIYDSKSPEFFWLALSYGVQYHTREIPLAETADGEIRVPRMAVQEFATGLFADYTDLLELSADHPTVRYDAEWDAYIFSASGCLIPYETRLLNAYQKEDGTLRVSAALFNPETKTPIRCYVFTLTPNAYADGITDPIFPYSVSSMTQSPAVNSGEKLHTLIGVFQGFSDHHTAEFLVDNNLMAFQVYDKEIISLLSQLKENQNVTLALTIDEATESKTIVSLIFK